MLGRLLPERRSLAPRIGVLLVDDHSLVRRGFRRLLEDDPEIVVVGEASDGHEAVDLVTEHHPAVVVMDFALPSMNGAIINWDYRSRDFRETEILDMTPATESVWDATLEQLTVGVLPR